MFLEKIFSKGKKENHVIGDITKQIKLLCTACGFFKTALETDDLSLMRQVMDIERSADNIRRDIISKIYEGAFLPFIRSNICRFVEIVDEAFDILEDAASEFEYLGSKLDKEIEEDCVKIADINLNMCDMLLIAFETLFNKGDLREKTLAIRIYEKKVDEIKFDLVSKLMKKEVKDFWEGRILSDFISYLTRISDVIEDASDYLHIINLSLR